MMHYLPIVLIFLNSIQLISSQAAAPDISTVYPDFGPKTGRTPVFIRGDNLGLNKEDIIELVVGGYSCLGTLIYDNQNSISCIATPDQLLQHSTAPNEGAVWVTTVSGGKSNTNFTFTFFDSCFMLTTRSTCEKAGKYGDCKWCKFSAKCVEYQQTCNDGCSSVHMKMTCPELAGIIIASIFLLSLVGFLIFFVIWVNLRQIKTIPKTLENEKINSSLRSTKGGRGNQDLPNAGGNSRGDPNNPNAAHIGNSHNTIINDDYNLYAQKGNVTGNASGSSNHPQNYNHRHSGGNLVNNGGGSNNQNGGHGNHFKSGNNIMNINNNIDQSEDDDDDADDNSPLITPSLSEKFLKHQSAIETAHRKLAGNKSLTSF